MSTALITILIICWLTAIWKGLCTNISILSVIRWMDMHHESKREIKGGINPTIIISLPVLREQRVLKETLEYFYRIIEDSSNVYVVVITTEKEVYDKNKNLYKLFFMAEDIYKGLSLEKLIERYLGLLPLDTITSIYEQARPITTIQDVEKLLHETYQSLPTTIDIARQCVSNLNTRLGRDAFFHVHYPHEQGVMAHQLNYLARNIESILIDEIDYSNIYFGVYNADSFAHPNTVRYITGDAAEFRSRHGHFPEAYQQSSIFTHNYAKYDQTLKGYILKSSAIFQTRWTLGNEIPLICKAYKFYLSKKELNISFLEKIFSDRLMYCIGHGLFIRLDILHNVGLFSERTMNEDIMLGYILCLAQFPVKPVPLLENTDNPETINSLITQKATWFWGSLQYPQYPLIAKSILSDFDKLRAFLLMIRGLPNISNWLFGSFFIAFMIIVPIVLKSYLLFICSIIVFILYSVISYVIIFSNWKKLHVLSQSNTPDITWKDMLLVPISSLIYTTISSIGPVITIFRLITSLIKGNPIEKKKTER